MKNTTFYKLLWLPVLLCLNSIVIAQDKPAVDDNRIAIVELSNGSMVEGEIVEWQFGESITLKFPWGATTKFEQSQIKKITQKSAQSHFKAPYNFKETGLYYNARLQIIAGNEGPRAKGVLGTGISFSAGHRFNRWFAIGGGVAYDRFIWESGENLIPVFVEIMGFLNKSNTSMFYNVQSGYAFAYTDDTYLLEEAKGGFMIYPNIGVKWAGENLDYQLSAGYKFQNAEFTYANPWTFGDLTTHDVLYKRLTISFGLLF